MTEAVWLGWQVEMCDVMRVGAEYQRRQLVIRRDELLRRSNDARIQLVRLGSVRNAKHRRARKYALRLRRQLNETRDACDRLVDIDQVVAVWQARLVRAVGWYLDGVVIAKWRDDAFVLQVDRTQDCLNVYFGGNAHADGLDHGHIVLSPDGLVTYRRNPGRKHGTHNYRVPGSTRSVLEYAPQ